jgi:hypothetical protein
MQLGILLLLATRVYLPSPYDKDGIGLRVHNLSDRGPYLEGEILSPVRFDLTLLNLSKATIEHDPFVVAKRTRELVVSVIDPDGKRLQPLVPRHAWPRPPFTVPSKLQPGERSTSDFQFKEFGFLGLSKPGRHRVVGTWTIGGRKYTSPPLEFDVVAVPPEAVLSSFTVAVADKKYETHPARPRIQQVRVAKKTLLIYTGFAGVARLAELPGKVEMTVEGAYNPGNPLTVKYRDEKSKTGWSTLVINSIGGTPWTEEEERARIERTKPPVPESPPAPQPVKP